MTSHVLHTRYQDRCYCYPAWSVIDNTPWTLNIAHVWYLHQAFEELHSIATSVTETMPCSIMYALIGISSSQFAAERDDCSFPMQSGVHPGLRHHRGISSQNSLAHDEDASRIAVTQGSTVYKCLKVAAGVPYDPRLPLIALVVVFPNRL